MQIPWLFRFKLGWFNYTSFLYCLQRRLWSWHKSLFRITFYKSKASLALYYLIKSVHFVPNICNSNIWVKYVVQIFIVLKSCAQIKRILFSDTRKTNLFFGLQLKVFLIECLYLWLVVLQVINYNFSITIHVNCGN